MKKSPFQTALKVFDFVAFLWVKCSYTFLSDTHESHITCVRRKKNVHVVSVGVISVLNDRWLCCTKALGRLGEAHQSRAGDGRGLPILSASPVSSSITAPNFLRLSLEMLYSMKCVLVQKLVSNGTEFTSD